MKKLANTVMTTQKCLHCNKTLKQNLINKRPDANLCYKCHRVVTGKPAHHVPRQKRIIAELPVHAVKQSN